MSHVDLFIAGSHLACAEAESCVALQLLYYILCIAESLSSSRMVLK